MLKKAPLFLFLFLTSLVTTAQQPDLNGLWTEGAGTYRLIQNGGQIELYFVKVPPYGRSLGFKPGDLSLKAKGDGHTFDGFMNTRYMAETMQNCPNAIREEPEPVTVTLTEKGFVERVRLNWMDYASCKERFWKVNEVEYTRLPIRLSSDTGTHLAFSPKLRPSAPVGKPILLSLRILDEHGDTTIAGQDQLIKLSAQNGVVTPATVAIQKGDYTADLTFTPLSAGSGWLAAESSGLKTVKERAQWCPSSNVSRIEISAHQIESASGVSLPFTISTTNGHTLATSEQGVHFRPKITGPGHTTQVTPPFNGIEDLIPPGECVLQENVDSPTAGITTVSIELNDDVKGLQTDTARFTFTAVLTWQLYLSCASGALLGSFVRFMRSKSTYPLKYILVGQLGGLALLFVAHYSLTAFNPALTQEVFFDFFLGAMGGFLGEIVISAVAKLMTGALKPADPN